MSSGEHHSVEDNPRNNATRILLRTCLTCDMFDEETETCRKWHARPPARTIAYGCDDYIEEIPF